MRDTEQGDTEVAKAVGVSQSMICNLRTIAGRRPSVVIANRIAKVSKNKVPTSSWGYGDDWPYHR